ncbi:MAG: hypothetical protein ACREI9_13040 [Nitrospiraceae bacterium]
MTITDQKLPTKDAGLDQLKQGIEKAKQGFEKSRQAQDQPKRGRPPGGSKGGKKKS